MSVPNGDITVPRLACDAFISRQSTSCRSRQNNKRNFPISCAASLQRNPPLVTAETHTNSAQFTARPLFTRAQSHQHVPHARPTNDRPDTIKRDNSWHSDKVPVASCGQYDSLVLPAHRKKSHYTIPIFVVTNDAPRKSFYYRQRDTDFITDRPVLDSSVLHIQSPNMCATTGPVLRPQQTIPDRWKKTRAPGVLGRIWRYLYSRI